MLRSNLRWTTKRLSLPGASRFVGRDRSPHEYCSFNCSLEQDTCGQKGNLRRKLPFWPHVSCSITSSTPPVDQSPESPSTQTHLAALSQHNQARDARASPF